MPAIFEMLNAITRRRTAESASPFASPKATARWLKNLHADSDYDAHHLLVEGLERFNAENATPSAARLDSLRRLEDAGLPLQARIVEQYVRNQATFRLARQALWRESWMFWSLLAEAWLGLLKEACRRAAGEELKAQRPAIAARALRYAGLAMRWDYHQARTPPEYAWRRLHKIYRLVERDGYAEQALTVASHPTCCAREYTLTVLMGLVNPLGYRAQEIEAIAHILEADASLPLPGPIALDGVHTHRVDLSLGEGAAILDQAGAPGRRLRYFALGPLVAHLKAFDAGSGPEAEGMRALTQQAASLIERGGVRRTHQRTHRFGRVWVAAGMERVLSALAHADPAPVRPALEPWTLRDESCEGMGFALGEPATLPRGRLVAVTWDPGENVWQLLAVRWSREEGGQHLIGAERLSRHPKRVQVYFEADVADAPSGQVWAVFLPMAPSEGGGSHLLLPRTHYRLGAALMLREGEAVYRLRLGEVQESHEDWLRVGMDVVGREQLAAAA